MPSRDFFAEAGNYRPRAWNSTSDQFFDPYGTMIPLYGRSNPAAPANQSGLQLTFLRHPGISAVARFFAGGEPVSTGGFGGFNGLRGRCLQGPILTYGFVEKSSPVSNFTL